MNYEQYYCWFLDSPALPTLCSDSVIIILLTSRWQQSSKSSSHPIIVQQGGAKADSLREEMEETANRMEICRVTIPLTLSSAFNKKCNQMWSKVYGAWQGPSSVHLVLSWPRHIKLWGHHINSWERDSMLWRLLMLRELHIFLVATSLMRKQTYVTIATQDYQRWIKQLILLTLNI